MGDLIKSAFQSLPVVATHPLALVGYVSALAVWLIVALKVVRHKNLLERLDKFPEKDRLKIMEREMGWVRVRGGLSAEQYLRQRIHFYYIVAFVTLCLMALSMFAISFVVKLRQEGAAGIDITPFQEGRDSEAAGANRAPSAQGAAPRQAAANSLADAGGANRGREFQVNYTYENLDDDKIHVRPDLPYLAVLAGGGPIFGSDSLDWDYPKLAVKAVNNTPFTLFLTEMLVRVKSSSVNTEPVIVIEDNSNDELRFDNLGWGKIINPVVSFGVAEASEFKDVDPESRPTVYTVRLNTFADRVSVPLDTYLSAYFKRVDNEAMKKSGKVYVVIRMDAWACVYGELSYRTEDSKARAVKFKTFVRYHGRSPQMDMLSNPSATYGLLLKAGQSGYTKRVPVAQYIKPGGVDLFSLRVLTDKSASFDLSFDFKTAEGSTLHASDMLLEVFAPRGGSGERLVDSPKVE